MAKKPISKISDKLAKVGESFTVYMYDNGFLFDVSGRDAGGDYKSAKIMVSTVEDLLNLVKEFPDLERDD